MNRSARNIANAKSDGRPPLPLSDVNATSVVPRKQIHTTANTTPRMAILQRRLLVLRCSSTRNLSISARCRCSSASFPSNSSLRWRSSSVSCRSRSRIDRLTRTSAGRTGSNPRYDASGLSSQRSASRSSTSSSRPALPWPSRTHSVARPSSRRRVASATRSSSSQPTSVGQLRTSASWATSTCASPGVSPSVRRTSRAATSFASTRSTRPGSSPPRYSSWRRMRLLVISSPSPGRTISAA